MKEESICVGCGLCCDGTLHSYTRVKEKDEAAVAAACLEVVEVDGQRTFRQPCPHFSNGRCGIYAQRPPVCRTYRCALLERVDDGRMSAPEAREKIAKAKMLAGLVKQAHGDTQIPLQRVKLEEDLRAELANASETRRAEIAKTLLDLGVLHHYLMRWFHKKSGEAGQMGKEDEGSAERQGASRK